MKKKDDETFNVIDGDFAGLRRADAPEDLTKSQKVIWKRIVDSEPPDFFSSAATQMMLKAAVCHLDTANGLTETINKFKREWIRSQNGSKMYDRLLKMRADESKAYGLLATKLRLTNQSRYTPQRAATTGREHSKLRPWEEADEAESG